MTVLILWVTSDPQFVQLSRRTCTIDRRFEVWGQNESFVHIFVPAQGQSEQLSLGLTFFFVLFFRLNRHEDSHFIKDCPRTRKSNARRRATWVRDSSLASEPEPLGVAAQCGDLQMQSQKLSLKLLGTDGQVRWGTQLWLCVVSHEYRLPS